MLMNLTNTPIINKKKECSFRSRRLEKTGMRLQQNALWFGRPLGVSRHAMNQKLLHVVRWASANARLVCNLAKNM